MTPLTVPAKWLVPAILLVILSPILSVLASVKIAENNADRQQKRAAAEQIEAAAQAQAAANVAREEARKVTCQLFAAILDGYREEPPSTESGINIQKTWLRLYKLSNCQPVRNE